MWMVGRYKLLEKVRLPATCMHDRTLGNTKSKKCILVCLWDRDTITRLGGSIFLFNYVVVEQHLDKAFLAWFQSFPRWQTPHSLEETNHLHFQFRFCTMYLPHFTNLCFVLETGKVLYRVHIVICGICRIFMICRY